MSAVRPRTADDLSPAELATAALDMDLVLKREPQLGDFGFGVWDPRSKTREERAAELFRDRDFMREPRSLAPFTAARGWLSQFDKIKALNRRGTSYGLKHCAEDDIGYVTNGVFIAAAIAEGFTVRRAEFDSANAWLNISTAAWRHVERGRDERRRLAVTDPAIIPLRMLKLPRDLLDRAIPVIVQRDASSHPLFASLDHEVVRRCLRDDLCQICGQRLMRRRWLVGGPEHAFNPRAPYVDLPGHLECMEYSLRTCPYLSVPNYLRKVSLDLPSHEGVAIFRSDSDERRPSPSLLVCVGATGRVSADFAFHVTPTGPCDRMQIWRHGKMVAEGGLDFIARLGALAAKVKAAPNQSGVTVLLEEELSIFPRSQVRPAPTPEPPAVGDYRFLISIELDEDVVGHAYVKCRTEPERQLKHYTFGLVSTANEHGFTTYRSGIRTTRVAGDEVERFLAAANQDFARSLTEYELRPPEESCFTLWIGSERDPIGRRLTAFHSYGCPVS